MPAIAPARLREQAARLAESFDQPRVFTRTLHGLLGLYADRTHRQGLMGEPPPLDNSYNVPKPVLRQISLALQQPASQDTTQTLALCQALWAEPNYEFRLLAASLLGQAPVESPESVLQQLRTWLESKPEEHIRSALLDQGVLRLKREKPAVLLNLARTWLTASQIQHQQSAMLLLRSLALNSPVDFLPSIFVLITPFIRVAPKELRPDLVSLLLTAITISPQETAYLLRQNLETPESPDTIWLIRQVLDEFPAQQQTILRAALTQAKSKNP